MSPMSFRELTPEQVVMLAIDVEEANGNRLRIFSDLFADYAPEAAEIFSEMAAEEDLHRGRLEAVYERRHGELQRTVGEADVRDVIEPHDLDDAEHVVFDSLSVRRALEVVLAAEHQALAFYRQAQENTDERDLRELYRELADFEAVHVRRIQAKLDALEGSA